MMEWLHKLGRWLALVPGRKALVVLANGAVVEGWVKWAGWRVVEISYVHFVLYRMYGDSVRGFYWSREVTTGDCVRARADEGTSWCRARTGPVADALRAVYAL